MKNQRKWITVGALTLLGASLMLFLNMTKTIPYIVFYQSGRGIPLSEISNTKRIEIKKGEVFFLDKSIEVDELVINGQLHCDEPLADDEIVIKARVIYVNGLLQCGTETSPYHKNITFSLKPGNVDPRTSFAYRGLIVNSGGKMILTGNKRNARWVRLNKTAEPGQDHLVLSTSVDNKLNAWKVGDEIVVAPTSYSPTESEKFKIVEVKENTITLSGQLLYRHWGGTETFETKYNGKVILDQRAEVANLTRNILIQADESLGAISNGNEVGAELGGHVMVMPGASAYVDSVEFYKMGQAGIIARYPFHWHIVGDAHGQFIKNSSIHKSYQRCITVHRTNYALVDNNVCHDFKGHGFFLEDGVEIYNTLTNNLGINARYPHLSKVLLASDKSIGGESSGRFPNVSVFWISHPKNIISNNNAAGSVGSGFWMAFENVITDSQGNVITRPVNEDTKEFSGNVAHSALVGFTWDGAPQGALTGNPNNPNDRELDLAYYKPKTVPLFKKLVTYKTKHTGIYFRGYSAVYDGGISADNGWNYWLAYNQIVKNAVIVGRSENFSSYDQSKALSGAFGSRAMQAGIVQYDGPFELNNVDFVKYPTEKLYAGYEVTPVPVAVIGGTERLTNASQRISFSPEPFYKVYMAGPETIVSLGIIGNSSLRDNDGTLTGIPGGGMVIGSQSLGVLPTDGCQDGGDRFKNHLLCPSSYTESELHLFNGDGNTNPWSMPFVMRRNDGALSDPYNFWIYVMGASGVPRRGGNKVALANSSMVTYEMMLGIQNPLLWVTSETLNISIPVTKVIGHGSNCSLTNASEVSSLKALKLSPVTAYYKNNDDFYFRIIPHKPFHFMVPHDYGTAKRYTSDQHNLQCTNTVTPYVKGQLQTVVVESSKTGLPNVIVSGWACNFSNDQSIDVKLYVGGPMDAKKSILLQTINANITSDATIAYACGVPKYKGFKFRFVIPGSTANLHIGKLLYLYGISNTGGASLPLLQSGVIPMPLPVIPTGPVAY